MNKPLSSIDPNSVPKRKLYTGAEIPAVGIGTYGSDRFLPNEIAEAVFGASELGYRHFDCAAVYANEKEIGKSFNKIIEGGLPREDFWVTSKLWNDSHAEEDVILTCKQTLADLLDGTVKK